MPPKGKGRNPTDDAFNWIAFEPAEAKPRTKQGYGKNSDAKRKRVRAAAATSSAATRLATMAKKRQREEEGPSSRPNPQGARPVATTELLRNTSMASKAFETHLWTRIIMHPDLHAVSMFLGSTEMNMLGLAEHGGHMQATPLFLRGMALKCMQKVLMHVMDPEVDSGLVRTITSIHETTNTFAICLGALAGWEKIHGDEAGYAAHMKALRAIVHHEPTSVASMPHSMDSGQEQQDADASGHHIFDVLHSVTSTIQKRNVELGTLISTDASLAIDPQLDTMQTMAGPIPTLDYSIYNLHRHDTRTLLFLLSRLANFNLMAPKGWSAMHELSLLVISWRMVRKLPLHWAGTLSREDLEDLALYHIRAAMVSVLGAWTYAIAVAQNQGEKGYFRASDSADAHYQCCLFLETYPLFGTPFEEVALWSLFVITATASARLWKQTTFDTLRRLITSPQNDIRSFEALEKVCRKYAYREIVHRKNCLALWKAVMEDVSPGEDVGLRNLEVTFADLMI